MADYRRTKFERRMKAYRDFQKKKEQESNEDTKEERTVSEEDKQKLIELWEKLSKK